MAGNGLLLASVVILMLIVLSHPPPAAPCWQSSRSRQDPAAFRFQVRGRWIVDEHGRVRLFHGFNSVFKGPPFIDSKILNATRAELYRQWGFNVVRLGAMWAGAEPVRQGQYNDTYLQLLKDAVEMMEAHGLYVILDMHQVSLLFFFTVTQAVREKSLNGVQ
jgi:hypothetical protein